MMIKYWFYRKFMRFIHKRNYHKMEISYPDGDTKYWCHWCGLSVVLKRDHFMGMRIHTDPNIPKNTIILTNLKVPEKE